MAKAWVIPVSKELNEETFEWAHKLKMSKAEFVRQAVKEKIKSDRPMKTTEIFTKTPEAVVEKPVLEATEKQEIIRSFSKEAQIKNTPKGSK